jgi:hypothetical protein
MATSPLKKIFTGFSTAKEDSGGQRDWTVHDIELVKRDLLNHFNTRMGERVMRPDFGCRIWDYLMEPMTGVVHDDIVSEVQRVCQADTRVIETDINVFDFPNGIRVSMTLEYVPYGIFDTFTATFERRQIDN